MHIDVLKVHIDIEFIEALFNENIKSCEKKKKL